MSNLTSIVQRGIFTPNLDDYKTISSYKGCEHDMSPETVYCLIVSAEVLVAAKIYNMMKDD